MRLLRNWISLAGMVLAIASLFSFLLLCVIDSMAHFSNPYVGILTYIVAPGFFIAGMVLTGLGMWFASRRLARTRALPALRIDLSRARDRKILGFFILGSILFLLISAIGSYQTYHFTESVQFCGEVCHTVMEPEMVTYQNGPHARVSCVECHIGPGATWFVKSKLSGAYQVYATAVNKYPRPVPTPIKNLRPAQDTCEQCHWPQKFVGDKVKTYHYYLSDETNTHHALKLVLKVGGADPTRGPVGGIHWHMNVANKVEYIATDEARQIIPWVRMTDRQGVVTEYRSPGFTNDISGYTIRTMDCMDCHNRPAHRYKTPNDAVSIAMQLGDIDPTLPWIKTNAVHALVQPYANRDEAMKAIATHLSAQYPNHPQLKKTIAAVQKIYNDNFFPEMKANWRAYPENIGHKDWPGCARCHDDEHTTADGSRRIVFSDCNTCHVVLAQGTGKLLDNISAEGHVFVHPADEIPEGFKCSDCHTGGP
ncbi:MAG TPA: NapC/NirT family cytochrome c [Verrucomicrobiota bacterium]|nr:NapC/NirT family cytochrome c [Verrucomicrobiota bacterium]